MTDDIMIFFDMADWNEDGIDATYRFEDPDLRHAACHDIRSSGVLFGGFCTNPDGDSG